MDTPSTQPEVFTLAGKRVFVAGHRGMVGSALVRRLERENCEIQTSDVRMDLRDRSQVDHLLRNLAPDVVVLAAAKVGGIEANSSYPAQFLYDNLMIEANVIDSARHIKVDKLLFLGSSCIYPKFAPQPISEDALLTGELESTNEWYAIAKIAGIKLCQAYRREYGSDFIAAMPTNLYGPGDNYDLATSHVVPALLRKAHEAKKTGGDHLTIWGSGTPKREFLHVDDLADACVFLLRNYSEEQHINVGAGRDIAISELARLICDIVGFDGPVISDLSKPDGTPRKLLSSDKIARLGWTPSIGLPEGLEQTYAAYLKTAEPTRSPEP